MAPLRRNTQETIAVLPKPLRIIASGTLFVTYTLSLPTHPAPSTVTRAHSVVRTRGGSASVLCSLLAQFPAVDAMLVAPLGGKDDGSMVLRELEQEGVSTRFCKIWSAAGVPSAWVMHSVETDTRTVINHNPLPDITHEEFVSQLGPLLAPENYVYPSPSASPVAAASNPTSPPIPGSTPPACRPNQSLPSTLNSRFNPNSPAPFDWLHFEGRSVKTTLSNINGLDGLARERKWRSHCVFSVDVGRKGRQGVEALIPHADVLFVNKHYAQTQSPHYATTPRAFLLSLTSIAPPHALLVAHWASEGAAVLSLPTREYFQSSGWVEERSAETTGDHHLENDGVESVRSGSDFWAGTRSRTPSSSAFTARGNVSDSTGMISSSFSQHRKRASDEDDDNDSQGTEMPAGGEEEVLDEVGAQDAFVAGMIYALSRRVLPGSPYTPSAGGDGGSAGGSDVDKGRWRLDECLRFATELAGRKARRRTWEGLADEMARVGWFDT